MPNLELDLKVCDINGLKKEDILNILKLRYNIYKKEGLINPNEKILFKTNKFLSKILFNEDDINTIIDLNKLGIDCDEFDFLPYTKHILIKTANELVAYLRLIEDNKEVGLPLDELYKEEHFHLSKKPNAKVAEISRYVISEKFRSRTLNGGNRRNFNKQIAYYLFRILYYYIFDSGVTDLLIITHPRHACIYQKYYFFSVLGEEKIYPKVNYNPAVLLHQNVKEALKKSRYEDQSLSKFIVPDEIVNKKKNEEKSFKIEVELD